MELDLIIKIVAIFLESFAFCFIFRIKGVNMLFASIGATLGCATYLFLSTYLFSYALSYIVSGFIISAYSEIMARIRKTPVTVFLVISIFPLVPGSNAYYMMEALMSQQYYLAVNQCMKMVTISASIALGLFMAASIIRFIPYLYPRKNLKNNT